MGLFKRKQTKPDCVHSWHLVDIETVYSNAGSSVDVDDYYVLRCEKCVNKRKVDEYELYKLRRFGLVKG